MPDPEDDYLPDEIPPAVPEDEDGKAGKGPSLAQQLVAMAIEDYRLIRAVDGRAYAVPRTGPALAVPIGSKKGLRVRLSASLYRRTGAVAGGSALSDCMTILEGEAADLEPTPVFLRVGRDGEAIVVDTGTETGHAFVITAKGWTVQAGAPVVFRRSSLTHPFPVPARDGSLDELRALINLTDEDFRLAIGWVVASYFCHIPHPILFVQGEQGTAKSNLMRTLLALVDPQPAADRAAPGDNREWAIFSNASWAFSFDNLTEIPEWFSNALCKGSTGDAVLQRELHSDEDVVLFMFLRVIAMTTIALKTEPANDLADRLLTLEPEVIEERMSEEEVAHRRTAALPGALGAILDLVAKVLAHLPAVEVVDAPRMADFARILAALDAATGWNTLESYRAKVAATGMALIEGNTLARALYLFAHAAPQHAGPPPVWEGGAADLIGVLRILAEERGLTLADIPTDVAVFGKRVREIAPSLRKVGVDIRAHRTKTRGRYLSLRRIAPAPAPEQDPSSSQS